MIATKVLNTLFVLLAAMVMLSASADAAPKARCVQCFAPPTCPPCATTEKCVIIPATCDDCGSGYCAPK
ncbi:hypothetical protein FBU30_003753 [Linnemannia zychae]|nr:hypothetical protein FBU30_003753 [Linnemannia zychae]